MGTRSDRSLSAAGRLRQEIFESIRGLVEFPHRGHTRTDRTSNPLRFQIVRDYLIAYAPDERPLTIVSVVHGRRNPRVIAAILRSRE